MYYGGPSAPAIARNGRLQRRGHDDGTRRRTPVTACALLWLTKLEQWAMGDVWSCWGDGGAVAVVEELRGRAVVGNGAGGSWCGNGCSSGRGRRPGKAKGGRGTARTGAGGVKAAPRRIVACVIRALATRGRRRGHVVRRFCRCRPLNGARSVRQSFDGRLTACFDTPLTANP